MSFAYLLLGGNLGDREKILNTASDLIQQKVGSIIKKSSVYDTQPWGLDHENTFLNLAMMVDTSLNPEQLLETILLIEEKLGRKRTSGKWKERIIDIDILFYENMIVDLNHLQIPHPYFQERRFAIVPLKEIAGEFIHPVLKISVNKILEECKDMLEVRVFKK